MGSPTSPFRAVPPEDWIAQNPSAFAIWDGFPASRGHTLVVPFRQIATWWDAHADEQADLLELVTTVKELIDERYGPDGYNVGFNAGAAAGQTVDHLHVHVIPRYDGDVPDPRGGIRHVIPGKGNYLASSTTPAPAVTAAGGAAELLDALSETGRLKLELLRCLQNDLFDRIDLVVSFIMRSGLELVISRLDDAVARGARVRILTTDYLDVTDPDALAQLLDLHEASHDEAGSLDAKVWTAPEASFHPKAYLFWSSTGAAARGFVGSSNLSRSGIDGGIEWNLGVDRLDELQGSFERLWSDPRAAVLDHEVLRTYRQRRRARVVDDQPVSSGVEIEPPRQPVAPTEIQREALTALEATRQAGHSAGLVVMATGLGKTWLAAFDSTRPSVRRVLFVAHREEILRQSLEVFRQVRPDIELGLFYGGEKQPAADVVFASVQTLHGRLDEFAHDAFDYVVMDEFHHAAARTYRRIIDHFHPGFLLGLTATPDRLDGADLLALCGDNLVLECDLVEGIRRRELSPFRYQGLKDITDFEPIPWRNGRFDPDALTAAVETRARADQTLEAWRTHGGGPTLAFCCSITHADFMAAHFEAAGIRAAAVHSGTTSAPRRASVRELQDGALDVIFTVDVFNEGVDVPEITTVMMLRPTESRVVFLQQLGRGLRRAEAAGKQYLQVIDFIGNHRSFLAKPRALLSLGGRAAPTPAQIVEAARRHDFELPEGCSVAYDLEAVDLLASMVRATPRDALAAYCRDYVDEHGFRPSAVQMARAGLNPRSAQRAHGHWFGLLADLEVLSDRESEVVRRYGEILRRVEREPVTKSYKLVTLRALLQAGAIRQGMPVATLAAASHQLVRADPRLLADVRNQSLPDPAAADPATWERYWRQWPIEHLTNASGDEPLFRLHDDRLVPTFAVDDAHGETFDAMVGELVEWRLADYLLRRERPEATAIRCRVSHADGRPMLFLDRERNPGIPEGWAEFTANGEPFRGNFVKVALNVAERPGERGNALHDLLRGWFGPSAGHPGTNHAVLLRETDGGWEFAPEGIATEADAEVLPLFADYAVACGAFDTPAAAEQANQLRVLPTRNERIDPTRQFVAFASGDSMDGGADPIRHGDPLLFEWARDVDRDDLAGSRVLVQQSIDGQVAAVLKRLVRSGTGWTLDSDAPDQPAIAGRPEMRIVARLERKLDQAAINPLAGHVGELFTRAQVPEMLGAEYSFGRWGQAGHITYGTHEILFVTLDKQQMSLGTEYHDDFAGPERLIWTSQNATGPETGKGKRLLEAPGNGQLVHLWCRRHRKDGAFTYCGLLVPLSHEGAKPMSVTFRLLTPLSREIQGRLL